ncbi:hypothetical protein [Streptomyces sp. NBC_01268]|uniref:hypothetical protein n=1 Tax=Streptomyces sp. NBC_01268 TaxID=2903806 RepID=UPI002E2F2298|nr:hypothetical protein [Streptomyces sp. NBC_01268]
MPGLLLAALPGPAAVAYVRAHARLHASGAGPRAAGADVPEHLSVDLQAAVTVPANRPVDSNDTTRLPLRYVGLRALADMGDLDRARQDPNEVHSDGLTLRSPVYRANLLRPDLPEADLSGARLAGARREGAGMTRAKLIGVDLDPGDQAPPRGTPPPGAPYAREP